MNFDATGNFVDGAGLSGALIISITGLVKTLL